MDPPLVLAEPPNFLLHKILGHISGRNGRQSCLASARQKCLRASLMPLQRVGKRSFDHPTCLVETLWPVCNVTLEEHNGAVGNGAQNYSWKWNTELLLKYLRPKNAFTLVQLSIFNIKKYEKKIFRICPMKDCQNFLVSPRDPEAL